MIKESDFIRHDVNLYWGLDITGEQKDEILENQRIANELRDMYEKSKQFIQESPDAWDGELIEHFIQKAEFILKNMIAKPQDKSEVK